MQRSPSITLGLVSRFLAAGSLCAAVGSCGSSEPTTPVADRTGESAHEEHQHDGHQHPNADHDGSSMAMQPTGNAMCPLYPDERVDTEYFVLYNGARIGLCCEQCQWEWDVLTDSEKKDYVQKMHDAADDAPAATHTDAG